MSGPPGGFVRRIIFSEAATELFEDSSAVLVTFELIEARAGGRE
jgi:hypothetical protein